MTCKERILSNDYVDVLFDFVFPKEYNIESQADYCYHSLNGNLGIFLLNGARWLGNQMRYVLIILFAKMLWFNGIRNRKQVEGGAG